MQNLFLQLQQDLTAFVRQRDDLVLLVRCPAHEAALVLQTLKAVEESSSMEVYWTFAQPFSTPEAYLEALIAQVQGMQDALAEIQAAEGVPDAEKLSWPPLPAAVHDAERPVLERLRALVVHTRTLLPDPEMRVVWVLSPTEIHDLHSYARLVTALVQHTFPNPWCHHVRFVVRDEPGQSPLAKALQQMPRIRHVRPPVDTDSLQESLKEDAADESLPLEQRMQALLQTAAIDFSHRRFEDALQKYGMLLVYFQATKNDLMQAVVLSGMGETHLRMKNVPEATKHFEAAMVPAGKAPAPPVVLNIMIHLAELKFQQQRWDEAEFYYDQVDQIATATVLHQVKLQALERRGTCEYAQGKLKEALDTWEAGAKLARGTEETEFLRQHLTHLLDLYRMSGLRDEQRAAEQELAQLGA